MVGFFSWKVGIRGPVIDFSGSFVGMNFYDGSEVTPFLPRSKIVEVLSRKKDYLLPSEWYFSFPLGDSPDSLLIILAKQAYMRKNIC